MVIELLTSASEKAVKTAVWQEIRGTRIGVLKNWNAQIPRANRGLGISNRASLSNSSLARRPNPSRDRLRRWQRNGWIRSRRDGDGHHVLWADADELRRLRELGRCLDAGESGPRLEELKKPKRKAMK